MTEPDADPSRGGRPPLAGILLVLLLALIWGVNWPAIRAAVTEMSPWTFRAICLAAGTVTLFSLSAVRRARLAVPRSERWPLIGVGLLNVTAWHMFSAYGLTMIEAGRGVILGFTFPLWSVLLGAIVLRERITAGRALALLLGFAAMALLLGGEIGEVGRSPLGALLLIGSAMCWAGATILMKSRDWSIGSGELAAWQLAIGAGPIFIGMLLIDTVPDFSRVSLQGWVGLIYSSAIAVAFGQWIWFRILRIMPSAVASISTLAIPVVGVFSSGLLLGEPIGWRELTALALVLVALFLVLVGREGLRALARVFGGREGRSC
jgi:drug/metabolite transporter (DMT)-like permease